MNFEELVDWAHAQLGEVRDALVDAGEPMLHHYRWWEPNMALPSAYLWNKPTTNTEHPDSCTVRDEVPLVLLFATRATEHAGTDRLRIEKVVDVALPIIDTALKDLTRQVRKRPRRQGFQLTRDQHLEGSGLILEVPVLVPLEHHIG